MTVKNPLPVPEDVQGYPNNDKAVMIRRIPFTSVQKFQTTSV